MKFHTLCFTKTQNDVGILLNWRKGETGKNLKLGKTCTESGFSLGITRFRFVKWLLLTTLDFSAGGRQTQQHFNFSSPSSRRDNYCCGLLPQTFNYRKMLPNSFFYIFHYLQSNWDSDNLNTNLH